jgi:hypothetical protein
VSYIRALSVTSLLTLSFFAAGCGSENSGPNPPGNNATGSSGSSGAGSSSSGGGNVGECNLNTGYLGDEMCILPPDPNEGLQLHYGPANYDDPAEVENYVLQPGEEVTDCYFVKTSNDQDRFFNEFHVRMRPGSHHLIVSAMNQDSQDGLRQCEGGGFSALLGGSQTAVRDYPDPSSSAPEDEGLANDLKAHTQTSLQLHFINTTTEPILREAWMNIIYKDPAQVTTMTDTIAHIGGLAAFILPGTEKMQGGTRAAPADIRIVNLFGHYHAHTVRFSTWKIDTANQKTLIYESYDYHEPGEMNFNTVTMNSPPDATTKKAGGVSGTLNLLAGERLQWECHVINDSTATLTFANEVFTGEMCNLFGTYAPSTGSAWISQNP